ncbi:MAG: aminomethyl-transferring glycine dehydrogenase subunit GcvPB [Candidatus Coatesbacteria bacterium]|nr:aminomethyl-transferring glycine dehydrogenase subunit GcvPB [Candidatus Coatesbacteria bacterium]
MADKRPQQPIEPAIYAHSTPGRRGYRPPAVDVPAKPIDELIPAGLRRNKPPALPEVDEPTLVRHYVKLSQLNHNVDVGFYPLGSCTMKYNPKIADAVAELPGPNALHPLLPEALWQPALEILAELERMLSAVTGMDRYTLQPAAGAQGEFTAIKMIRAYHTAQGDPRKVLLVADSAHGTNPASGTMCSYDVVEVASDERGNVDPAALKELLCEDVAALMLTNPSTLGLFEEHILEVAELVHSVGGQLYYDGANLNALMGRIRPGDMGFDAVHLNLHKTFGTPHGGGGPGSGPVGVKEHLAPYLPVPTIERHGEGWTLDWDRPDSIGKLNAFYGHFLVNLRAWAYLRFHGLEGLRNVSAHAVLNANYLLALIKDLLPPAHDRTCMHEFVVSARELKEQTGLSALDLSKRIIDYGFHPPTNYFPLIVPEAWMIEPTETETRETLEAFAAALRQIIEEEAPADPELLHGAPWTAPVRRVDEVQAVRELDVCWPEESD